MELLHNPGGGDPIRVRLKVRLLCEPRKATPPKISGPGLGRSKKVPGQRGIRHYADAQIPASWEQLLLNPSGEQGPLLLNEAYRVHAMCSPEPPYRHFTEPYAFDKALLLQSVRGGHKLDAILLRGHSMTVVDVHVVDPKPLQ